MWEALVGLLALSGLSGFLALCLEAADALFADYGECAVRINEGEREITVQGGIHLLAALSQNGIFVPSACGGRGSCGLCKLKVLEGGGPLLPTETPYLSPDEVRDRVRLACQVKVRNDLSIEIPPELFLIKEYRCRVARIRDLAPNIKEFTLELLEPGEIPFKPGQFIQLQIPEYEGCSEPVYRAYSIASSASRPNTLTLVITRVPNGVATTYLHEHLREGDEVWMNGPHGEFFLRDSDRDMLFIATGSGLAPMMSLLHQVADEGITRQATLVLGARYRDDLFYLDELEALKQRIPTLRVFVTLSKPPGDESWQGERGRVTDVIRKIVPKGDRLDAYICGNPRMVESVEELLASLGVSRDRIFYDKFG